ncbi:14534_t:CDS:2 [Cetraspora pellucida]|uniref:14534_t:CDS:1 n=1 Tax=Cetraspora pellucida TaxID=1433469 RepID=A0A9N9AR07_9GLOM|nr:14534_t:CDS:2 [Cetraspora pellucida]
MRFVLELEGQIQTSSREDDHSIIELIQTGSRGNDRSIVRQIQLEEVKLQLADQQNKIEKLIIIVQQKGFDGSDNNNNRQLIDMINAELVSLNDHNGLISDKLDTFETLLRNHNSNGQNKNNFSSSLRYPKAIKRIRKRIYNEQSDEESIQGKELINNTRHSYHKMHPTLVRYLYRKIKLHRKKKLAYDNKTLPANQIVSEEYLPDISNMPTAGNNPIDYLALKKNPDTFNNRNIKQRRDNHLSLEEIKLILHKRCILPELTDEEHQELHSQDKKQLLVAPIYWRSDEHVYPESDHSQYDELIGLSPDKLSFLPD